MNSVMFAKHDLQPPPKTIEDLDSRKVFQELLRCFHCQVVRQDCTGIDLALFGFQNGKAFLPEGILQSFGDHVESEAYLDDRLHISNLIF